MSKNSSEYDEKLKKAIKQFGHHNHICLIYETKDEQVKAIVPFIKQGIRNREKCIYICADNSSKEVKASLGKEIHNLKSLIQKEQLLIIDINSSYLQTGSFNQDSMSGFLDEQLKLSKEQGFCGLRITGEESWVAEDGHLIDKFIKYESAINHFYQSPDVVGLCQYNKNHFTPRILKQVIFSHPIVIYKGTVSRNYNYIPPEKYLNGEYEADEMTSILEQIVTTEKYVESVEQSKIQLEEINKRLKEEIASRKKANAELRTVIENIPVGIWQTDENGVIIYANQIGQSIWQGAKYVGIDQFREYKGWWLDTGKLIEPEDWAVARAILKGEASFNEKIKIQCFDGSFKTILNSAMPVFNEEKKIIGAVIVNQDITDLRRTEEKIAYQAMLLENVNDAIIALDKDLCITFWNEAAEKVYGWTSEEVLGKNMDDLVGSLPSEPGDEQTTDGSDKRSSIFTDFIHHDKSGRRLNIRSSIMTLRDNEGHFTGRVCVNRNVTALKAIENQLKKEKASLEARDEISDAFAKAAFDQDEILNYTVKKLTEVVCQGCIVRLLDKKEFLNAVAFHHSDPERLKHMRTMTGENITYHKNGNLTGNVTETGRSILMNEAEFENNRHMVSEVSRKYLDVVGIAKIIIAPLLVQNSVIGSVAVWRDKDTFDFTSEDEKFLQNVANKLALTIANTKLLREKQSEIEERKRAEEALRSQQALLREVLEITPVGVWVLDKEGKKLIGNKMINEIWHGIKYDSSRDLENYKGWWADNLREILPEEWASQRALKGETSLQEEIIIECFDGSKKTIYNSAVPLFGAGGEVSGAVIVNQDITELKKMSDKNAENARLLDLVNDAILLIDENMIISSWNKGAERMYGWTSDEAVGENALELISTDPALSIQIIDELQEEAKGSIFEVKQRKKSGEIIDVETSTLPLFDKHGNYRGVITVNRNITERKKAEEILKLTLEELKRSNKELEQFAYVASHDLQEPLRMVTSYTQLLAKRYGNKLDQNADQYIGFAVEGAKRMHELIKDLLAYSRVSFSQRTEFERVDCNSLVKKIISGMEIQDMEKTPKIIVDPLPVILASPEQMKLLFQNLLYNAVKFHGEEKPVINISARKEGNEWLFSVKDNGIGINPDYHEKIFVIFQRLHSRMKYPGTGIGLPICKKIAEYHGGRIWVESEEGKGSTFYFTIPARG